MKQTMGYRAIGYRVYKVYGVGFRLQGLNDGKVFRKYELTSKDLRFREAQLLGCSQTQRLDS